MFFQAQQADQFFYFFPGRYIRLISQPIGNIFIGIQMREQGIVLKYDIESPFFHRHIRQIFSFKNNPAAICLRKPQDQVKQRRLSASGGSQDGYDLAFFNLQADILQDGYSVK